MTMNKYASGAFCFYRVNAFQPVDPDECRQVASDFGLDPAVVPEYAGDRETVARTIAAMAPRVARQGWLLKAISNTKKTEAIYGLEREHKDASAQTIHHSYVCKIAWDHTQPEQLWDSAHAGTPECDIADLIASEYLSRRGKIIAQDWTRAISAYLTRDCMGCQMRDDGRIYWLPPTHIAQAESFAALLYRVGINLVLCRVEPEDEDTARDAMVESIAQELTRMQDEIAQFDDTTKPSTYAARLEAYADLKTRATAYKAALGISVDDCTRLLDDLSDRVEGMLHTRKAKQKEAQRESRKRAAKEQEATPAFAF